MRGRDLVGRNIKRIRVAKGVSQEQLAFDASVDRSYLGGIERMKIQVSIRSTRLLPCLGLRWQSFFSLLKLKAKRPAFDLAERNEPRRPLRPCGRVAATVCKPRLSAE